MYRTRILAVTLLLISAPAVLNGQPAGDEAVVPIVDSKYGSAEEIVALPAEKLVALLEDPGASLFAKSRACQRLAVTGGKSAVSVLASLLPDPQLSHYARFALEPISDPSVDRALRDALGRLEGKLLVGVINSVGRRKDVEALDALGDLLGDSNPEVARAAAEAVRRIRPSFY